MRLAGHDRPPLFSCSTSATAPARSASAIEPLDEVDQDRVEQPADLDHGDPARRLTAVGVRGPGIAAEATARPQRTTAQDGAEQHHQSGQASGDGR